jgi:hypothetical protein
MGQVIGFRKLREQGNSPNHTPYPENIHRANRAKRFANGNKLRLNSERSYQEKSASFVLAVEPLSLPFLEAIMNGDQSMGRDFLEKIPC